jgi:hypothetical protein
MEDKKVAAASPALALVHGEPGHAAVRIRNHPAAALRESVSPFPNNFSENA